MLCTCLGIQFSSHGELDGESSHFCCENLFKTMSIAQMHRCFRHEFDVPRHGRNPSHNTSLK
jgi:hypothetical protein